MSFQLQNYQQNVNQYAVRHPFFGRSPQATTLATMPTGIPQSNPVPGEPVKSQSLTPHPTPQTDRQGGGCANTDVLLPDLPFDFLQPPMTAQLLQIGYGGPFVIRSNPIGAVFDAIRGFCFPVPMKADESGMQYEDLSGMGLGTFGSDTGSIGLGPSEGTPFIGGYGSGSQAVVQQPSTGGQCGTGTVYDAGTMACVPSSGGVSPGIPSTTCGPDSLDAAVQKLANAAATCDLTTVNLISYQALGCAAASPMYRAQWQGVQREAKNRQNEIKSGSRGCQQMSKVMASRIGRSVSRPNISNQRMPSVVNPLSLTESTPHFRSSKEPLGGSYDPRKVIAQSTRKRSFSQMMMSKMGPRRTQFGLVGGGFDPRVNQRPIQRTMFEPTFGILR